MAAGRIGEEKGVAQIPVSNNKLHNFGIRIGPAHAVNVGKGG